MVAGHRETLVLKEAIMNPRARLSAIFCLCLSAWPVWATELKVATEFRYPTSYTIEPGTPTIFNADGSIQVAGTPPIVVPSEWATREVGIVFRVYAQVSEIAGLAGVNRGDFLINDNTLLMLAATSGEYDATRKLVARGADVNMANRFGSTALMGASAGGYDDIVRLLLRRKARADATSELGITPLTAAARNGHSRVIGTLLENGAGVDAPDGDGVTPLMHAVDGGHVDAVRVLVKAGADVNQRDRGGETPLMLAKARNEEAIVVMLTRVGAGR